MVAQWQEVKEESGHDSQLPLFLKHQLNLVSSLTSSNLNILETKPSDLRFQKEEKPRMPEQTIEDQPGQLVIYRMLGLKKSAVLKSHQKLLKDRNLFFFEIFFWVTFGFVSYSHHPYFYNNQA